LFDGFHQLSDVEPMCLSALSPFFAPGITGSAYAGDILRPYVPLDERAVYASEVVEIRAVQLATGALTTPPATAHHLGTDSARHHLR
jgi:hypothetical protein